MYKLIISELAHGDLDNIVSYIAIELVNPMAAAAFLNEIDKCYEYLKSNPFMYELSHDPNLKKEGYHRVPVKNYVLIYKN